MLKLKRGSWLALVYLNTWAVFFSPCADRALGYISGQACTAIITVRSGSAWVRHRSYHDKCTLHTQMDETTHGSFSLLPKCRVWAGYCLKIFWKQFSNITLWLTQKPIRNVAIIKYCLELATDTFLNRYINKFWLIPKSRGSITHPYTCPMSPT